jgi:myo-inositol-1(or 4)-monophosphatase
MSVHCLGMGLARYAPTRFAGVSDTNLLESAIDAARAGGARLMDGLSRPPEIHQKSARANIVTWADDASQATIVELLLRRYPDHAILGEEGSAGNPDGPYTWIVDPLDGTSNYARGISPWGVSIAVRETGGPLLAGVILDPLRGEMFAVERGGGTTCRPSDTIDVGRALIATGLQNDEPAAIHEHALRIEQMHLHCRGTRAIGCPSFALAYVAAGKLDGFVEKDGTYAWDVAAAVLLLEEAGGVATDFDGGPVNLGVGITNIVASNAQIHSDLVEIVNLRRAGREPTR